MYVRFSEFRAKEIKYFGALKRKKKFPYVCPAVERNSYFWFYIECMSQSNKNLPLKLVVQGITHNEVQ